MWNSQNKKSTSVLFGICLTVPFFLLGCDPINLQQTVNQQVTAYVDTHTAKNQVSSPEYTPIGPADLTEDTSLVISSTTPGATIYYSAAQSVPGDHPTVINPDPSDATTYTGKGASPLTISLTGSPTVWSVKAIAAKSGMANSTLSSSGEYTLKYQYVLTMTNDGHGTTNPSSTQNVGDGDMIQIQAYANSGYAFDYWEVTSGTVDWGAGAQPPPGDPPFDHQMIAMLDLNAGNATIKAHFTLANYTVTTQVTTNAYSDALGSTDHSTPTGVVSGNSFNITATPQPGCLFTGWTVVSGSVTFGNASSATTSVTPTSTATIKANFVEAVVLDPSFTPGTGANNEIKAMAVQTDNKILIAGLFTSYNGTQNLGHLARLNADGTIDSSFATATGTGADLQINALVLLSSGKILIGGAFTDYNGTTRNKIALLNSDGSLDTNFDPGNGPNGTVYTIAVQSDGKVLIGGNFNSNVNFPRAEIARLTSTGALDTGFLADGNGFDGAVFAIYPVSTTSVVVGGQFHNYWGSSTYSTDSIALLSQTDGSIMTFDGSMNTPGLQGTGFVSTIIPSGTDFLIAGRMSTYHSASPEGVAKISSTGTFVSAFDTSPGISDGGGTLHGDVNAEAVDANSKVLLGGNFASYGGQHRASLVRLNSNGTLDTSFLFTSNANGVGGGRLNSIVVQSDGAILIAGSFSTFDGTSSLNIARLVDNNP